MDRRNFLAGSAACSLAAMTGKAFAQSGPLTKIIFPFAAGGSGDLLCRQLAQYLPALLDRNFIVENRTGGDGLIGIRAVKGANPDGTTILMTTGPTMYLLPMVENQPSFDSAKDFVPVSQLTRFEFAVVVSPAIEVKDFKELVAWLKANPGKATYGTPGSGNIPHFTGWQLEQALGLSMTKVPYRGSALMVNDLIAGHIPFGITTVSDTITQHRAGGLRIVAVGQRDPFFVLARHPDSEGERRQSGGGRLVRHVAAGRQLARVRKEAEHGRRRGVGEVRGEGKAARGDADSGWLHAGAVDAKARG